MFGLLLEKLSSDRSVGPAVSSLKRLKGASGMGVCFRTQLRSVPLIGVAHRDV